NTSRFATQSIVLVGMDVCSLLFYLLTYRANGQYYPGHVTVHLVKIALMLLCYFYFSRLNERPYDPTRFIDRACGILYPSLHLVLEICLYVSGPQDLGAFVRLMAVPFIVGCIPILSQPVSCVILTATFVFYFFYVYLGTPYGAFVQLYAWVHNLFIVVYACALLLSFTVYSWFVNNFVSRVRERRVRRELSTLNEKLDHMSRHDALTGLLNRHGFQQFMDATWAEHAARANTASVIMIDIDHFKLYNDRFGHLAGDECLHCITEAINTQLTGQDYILARYGGEEFIAVAYGQPHGDMVEHANHLRKKVMDLQLDHPDSETNAYVTISLGVATQNVEDLDSFATLIDWADDCLYYAKRTGRNRIIHTVGRRGDYRDVHGVSLVPRQKQQGTGRSFDDERTQRLLKDIGANCTFVYDGKTQALYFSAAAVQLFGVPSSLRVPGRRHVAEALSVAPEDARAFNYVLNRCLENHEPVFSLETNLLRRAHAPEPVAISAQCSYTPEGTPDIIFGTIISIDKMLEYSHYLVQQSQTNALTLLPNRNRLNIALAAILAQPDSHGHVVFIDIRDFKGINGYYGHSIGDKVLRETAHLLSRLAGDYLPAYNYDLDQFAIVAQNATKDDASHLMDAIYRHFSGLPTLIEGLDLHIDLSIVAVAYTGGSSNVDQLFLDLDAAVQTAKFNPHQQYAFFDSDTKAAYLARVNLTNALKKSIENQFSGFALHYQPIFDAKTGRCVGAEALLRWQNEAGETVPPTIVIPVLERSDWMVPVEEWILNTACQQCAQWIRSGASGDFFVNINLSAAKIGRATLYSEVMRAIETHQLTLKNVTLEVTESSTLMGRRMAISTLATLHQQGVRIAIDDFGTGYSSLSYLNTLPASEIKIDRSFVTDIDQNPAAEAFLAAIVGMVKSMGYVLCVEGVERQGQDMLLNKQQVDYLQGYLYGKPAPADTFARLYLAK
ncbi:MAG: diguanylate cyclase, partial [Oscillospiraceae bacterium]